MSIGYIKYILDYYILYGPYKCTYINVYMNSFLRQYSCTLYHIITIRLFLYAANESFQPISRLCKFFSLLRYSYVLLF